MLIILALIRCLKYQIFGLEREYRGRALDLPAAEACLTPFGPQHDQEEHRTWSKPNPTTHPKYPLYYPRALVLFVACHTWWCLCLTLCSLFRGHFALSAKLLLHSNPRTLSPRPHYNFFYNEAKFICCHASLPLCCCNN